MLLHIRLFKYLVYLFKCLDFKKFCFVVIYIIVAKNVFIYIYIKLYYGWGGAGPCGALRAGMGQGSLPRTLEWGRAGTKILSSGLASPHCHPGLGCFQHFNTLWNMLVIRSFTVLTPNKVMVPLLPK